MTSASWNLGKNIARMDVRGWRAELDLSRPSNGLMNLEGAGLDWPDGELLGPRMPGIETNNTIEPAEAFARGDAVVAVYELTAPLPLRAAIQWRHLIHPMLGDDALIVELTASIATDGFDIPVQMDVHTRLPGDDVVRRDNTAGERFETITPTDRTITLGHDEGAECVLLRRRGSKLSFGALARRDEVARLELDRAIGGEGVVLRHVMVDWELEKGVTLRSRVVGLFLPAEDDEQHVLAYHRNLAEQPPVLQG
jgi:hypothetical protein